MFLADLRRSLDSFGWSVLYSALLHSVLAALAIHLSATFSATPVQVSVAPGFLSIGFTDSQTEFSSGSPSAREPSARTEVSRTVPGPEVTESGSQTTDSRSAGPPEVAANREESATGFAEGALVNQQSGWGNRPPIYPTMARKNGWEGDVLLRVKVLAQGTAQDVEVIQSSNYPVLDDAAVTAVARWRFTPARRQGKPVDSPVEIPIWFRLRDKGNR